MAAQSTTTTDIEDILKDVLEKMGQLPSITGDVAAIFQKLAASVSPLISSFIKLLSGGNASAGPDKKGTAGSTTTAVETALIQQLMVVVTSIFRLNTSIIRLATIFERMVTKMNEVAQERQALGSGSQPKQLTAGSKTPSPPGNSSAAPAAEAGGAEAAGMSLGSIAAVGAVAAAALGVLVVAIAAAQQAFSKMEEYVRLFNPTVVVMFQQALDNLGATIGRAFVPVFQVMTDVVRQFTAALAPVMQTLVPIVQQFAQMFGGTLMTVMKAWASMLQTAISSSGQMLDVFMLLARFITVVYQEFAILARGLMMIGRILYEVSGLGTIVRILTTVFEAFSSIFQIVEEAFNIFETVLKSIIDAITTAVSSFFSVKGIMQALVQAVQNAVRYMYIFAIMLAKLAGMDSVVAALLKNLEDKANAKGDTAASTPQIKSIEQLSKDTALAAASAGGATGKGGSGVDPQQEFWKKVHEDAKNAAANGVSIKDILNEIKAYILSFNPFKSKAAPPPATGREPGLGGLAATAPPKLTDVERLIKAWRS